MTDTPAIALGQLIARGLGAAALVVIGMRGYWVFGIVAGAFVTVMVGIAWHLLVVREPPPRSSR